MGDTFHLCCKDCQRSVWIAQRGSGNPMADMSLYTGDNEVMEALRQFLIAHLDHDLIFTTMNRALDLGYLDNDPETIENRRRLYGPHWRPR